MQTFIKSKNFLPNDTVEEMEDANYIPQEKILQIMYLDEEFVSIMLKNSKVNFKGQVKIAWP